MIWHVCVSGMCAWRGALNLADLDRLWSADLLVWRRSHDIRSPRWCGGERP